MVIPGPGCDHVSFCPDDHVDYICLIIVGLIILFCKTGERGL